MTEQSIGRTAHHPNTLLEDEDENEDEVESKTTKRAAFQHSNTPTLQPLPLSDKPLQENQTVADFRAFGGEQIFARNVRRAALAS